MIGPSREELVDHHPADVGQAEVAALGLVRQSGVVQAQEVEDRRLEVVDVDRVLGDVEPQVVGRPQGDPGLDPARRPSRS